MADVAQRIWPGLVGVLDQPFLRIGLTIVAAFAAIAWITMAFWCFRDTRARTRNILAPYLTSGMVLLFSPLLFPFGLAIYALVRPRETSHERDLRTLARTALDSAVAASSCRACGERIDRRWVRCPACAIWLAATCRRCDRTMDPDWSICPWCAAPQVVTGTPAAAVVAMSTPHIAGNSSRAAGSATAASPAPRIATMGLPGPIAAAIPEFGLAPIGTAPATLASAESAASAASAAEAAPAPAFGLVGSSTAATTAVGRPVPTTSDESSGASVAPSRIAVGPRAAQDSRPVPMGPARARSDREAPPARSDREVRPATDRVPPPRPAGSMKRLRAVREGVRTAQSLGDRRPVTGARVVQSTSAARTASAVETEAESLGANHAVPRRT